MISLLHFPLYIYKHCHALNIAIWCDEGNICVGSKLKAALVHIWCNICMAVLMTSFHWLLLGTYTGSIHLDCEPMNSHLICEITFVSSFYIATCPNMSDPTSILTYIFIIFVPVNQTCHNMSNLICSGTLAG